MILIILILSSLFFTVSASAQEISAKASASDRDYLIGNKIDITITIKRPENFNYRIDSQDFLLDPFEKVDSTKTDSLRTGKFIVTHYRLFVAAYDSGIFSFPAQSFAFAKTGDTTVFHIKTNAIPLHISTITVDPKKDIKPIDDPVKPPRDWWLIIIYSAAGLLIAVLLFFIIRYFVKMKKAPKPEIPEPAEMPRPEWEYALEKLAKLQQQDLPGQGHIKEYYTEISLIIRDLISKMSGIDAMEMTSDELITRLEKTSFPNDNLVLLQEILTLADLVKFAKYLPVKEDHPRIMQLASQLIEKMRDEAIYPGNKESVISA